MMQTLELECITPLFSYGADQQVPQIRAASIRGQLHQWFRLLGNDFESERYIFGGISINKDRSPTGRKLEDHAGRIMVRVGGLPDSSQHTEAATLPHKPGGAAAPKACFKSGTCFKLHIQERLGGLGDKRQAFEDCLQAWLHLGALGTRANRGSGSLQIVNNGPKTPNGWEAFVSELEKRNKLQFIAKLLPTDYPNAEDARKVITNTLGGPKPPPGAKPLSTINNPLGGIGRELRFGNRKSSPLKLRVLRFDDGQYRIAAVWDTRHQVTGNTIDDLKKVIQLLTTQGNHPIGRELAAVFR